MSEGRFEQPPATQTQTDAKAVVDVEKEARRRTLLTMVAEADDEPGPAPTPEAEGGGRRWLPKVAFAGAIIAAVAVAFSALLGPGSDSVSEADKRSWAAAFAAATPIALEVVPYEERGAAIAQMDLPPPQARALDEAVAGGQTRLVWVTVQDVVAEDGDWVRLQSEGYETEVMIRHEITKVVLPEPSSGIVNILGTRDGGGGITISITSGGTPVNLPFMVVGQELGIPVVVSR